MRLLTALTVSIVSLIVIILFISLIFENTYAYPTKINYGVSFSPNYAEYLGLDWQKTFIQILDDLKVRNLRLPSFWDTIQKDPQKDDFSELDFMISEAEKRQAKVILVVGIKQPRWPECHIPSWAKKLSLSERQQKALEFIQIVVEKYKSSNSIVAWQVENEPFVGWFGENCDPPDRDFLQKEVELVRKLDSKRLIMITDSGEWSFWVSAMKSSDIFGTTVYRKAYDPVLGYKVYPILPYLYNLKSSVARIFAPKNKKTIIAELQAEPWLSQKDSSEGSPTKQSQIFSMDDFKDYIDYAKNTGFDEAYLWGMEWWFWMAQNGYPEYLEYAKTLFK